MPQPVTHRLHDGFWETAFVFVFEVLTDIAFVPALLVMTRRGRHFELFIGVFQLFTGFLYNFCNALNTHVFLRELQWHGLNSILTTTYFLLLLINLQANSNPTLDVALRYAAFALVWLAQIKDDYRNPRWTAAVVLLFCAMPIFKFGLACRLPPYDIERLCKGLCAGFGAAVCFVFGVDDTLDPLRVFHGLSQGLVGLALYYLWQLVPLDTAKKFDGFDPRSPLLGGGGGGTGMGSHAAEGPATAVGGGGGRPRGLVRPMSTADLPVVTRIAY